MTISRAAALQWIENCAGVIAQNREYLIALDAAIGDADHGANMDRGFQAALAKLPENADKDIGAIFKAVGMALVTTVGGAGGPLYGTFYLQAGGKLSGKMEMSLEMWAEALEAAVNGVMQRGKAKLGDKTMVDALLPAVSALKASVAENIPLEQALLASAEAARRGMEATIPLVARKGRASYLGERSAGHQDPGATSSYLLLKTAADTWADG
jgi:dihydroxyacetone kinase-like protein